MKNERIKAALLQAGMYQWELAKLLGVAEGTLSRKMREELPEDVQERICNLISGREKNNEN